MDRATGPARSGVTLSIGLTGPIGRFPNTYAAGLIVSLKNRCPKERDAIEKCRRDFEQKNDADALTAMLT